MRELVKCITPMFFSYNPALSANIYNDTSTTDFAFI